ncbi:kinase family [Musa troglodytarum]|uniref:Kinase family n=1 Tax=Musa troglodytarum TaxID=320322 RepID=A0A9E7K4K1_9LILI|nr:kinase family [Musa troglodytarum]
METPAEELLKKIQELEAGQAHLKLEMSKLMPADEGGARRSDRGRSHSVSPQRTAPPPQRRNSGGLDGAPSSWGRGSSSFGHSSRLQRESRGATCSADGAAGVGLSERQYLNILQSMGQSVHIFDLEGRVIYWSVAHACFSLFFEYLFLLFIIKWFCFLLGSFGQSGKYKFLAVASSHEAAKLKNLTIVHYWYMPWCRISLLQVVFVPYEYDTYIIVSLIVSVKNRSAANLYGYTASEALGQNAIELLVDAHDFNIAGNMVRRVTMGESWTGKLPMKNKLGECFVAITTNTPFYDDDGSLVGIICVSSDSRSFQDLASPPIPTKSQASVSSTASRIRKGFTSNGGSDPQQPLQIAIASKITNLATRVTNKVRSRIKPGENNTEREIGTRDGQCSDHDEISSDHKEDGTSSGASTPRGEAPLCAFGKPSAVLEEKSPGKATKVNNDEDEGKSGIHKIISKTEALFANKGLLWPWKGNEQGGNDAKNRFVWPWLHGDHENDCSQPKVSESGTKTENQPTENNRTGNNEASGSWSSLNVNSTSSVSSCGSTGSSAVHKVDVDTDCLDYEILWEDLTIGEQIGQGSCGTVYHALWYGSDVAIKVFSKQEYSDDIILSFRQEVLLPFFTLFGGSIFFLVPFHDFIANLTGCGSLFRLLQRNTTKLDWRRRIHMALDIVGDFGLSRLKHETYLTTKSGKGTPQWMAPEVLRNERSDEKSDVYSYGVILWELVTEKIPWDNFNSMQVIAAVGFMNQRLDLPKDLNPQWVSIIESCWHSEPKCRPTFQELIERFKDLQRQQVVQSHMQRAGETTQSTAKASFQDRNEPD